MTIQEIFELRVEEIKDLADRVGIMYYYDMIGVHCVYRGTLSGLYTILMFTALDFHALNVLWFEYEHSMPKHWVEYKREGKRFEALARELNLYFLRLKRNLLLTT